MATKKMNTLNLIGGMKFVVNLRLDKHTEAANVWLQYASAWSAIDHRERSAIVAKALSSDVVYRAPNRFCEGREEVIREMQMFQRDVSGGTLVLRSATAHHDTALITWQLILPHGTESEVGYDMLMLSPKGEIENICSFVKRRSNVLL